MTSADEALARRDQAVPAASARPTRGNVRTLSRSGRSCARPGCPAPAKATLVFQYGSRRAELLDLTPDPTPAAYDLCTPHAGRTHPPHGWSLRDARTAPPDASPRLERPDETVALLAAALGRTPDDVQGDVPSDDVPGDVPGDVSSDVPARVARDVPGDVVRDVAGDVARPVAGDVARPVSGEVADVEVDAGTLPARPTVATADAAAEPATASAADPVTEAGMAPASDPVGEATRTPEEPPADTPTLWDTARIW